jgi:hypothetical protein
MYRGQCSVLACVPTLSERVLGHTIKGVEGTYDQHDYEPEKADALIRLAALVD